MFALKLFFYSVLCGDELGDISSFPGEKRYEEGAIMWNARFADVRPAFIAFPESAEDIQRCLRCSMDNAVPSVVKCGGHSSAGYSTIASPGFVIHLDKMRNISLNGTKATIQAGAVWGEVYEKFKGTGYLIAGGTCAGVGISGYTLGGGQGFLNRLFGLGCDNVESMTMVTANGSDIVFINETINSDLFWALRGGGGGNFGIMTEFVFNIHYAPLQDYVKMTINFDAGSISQQAFALLGELEPKFSDDMYSIPFISSSKEFQMDFLYLSSRGNDLAAIVKPLVSLANRVTYHNYSSYYDILNINNTHVASANISVLSRGCFLNAINKNVSRIFFESSVLQRCSIFFNHLGGAIRKLGNSDTAFFYRDPAYIYYAECKYSGDGENYIVFLDSLYEALDHNGYCLGNYVNDINKNLSNWQEKYYGGNYDQLLSVKEKWNAFNSSYFHFLQEIGSKYEPPQDSIATVNDYKT